MRLDDAKNILGFASEHAAGIGAGPLTIAVVDGGGHLKALWRQDGASTLRPEMAAAKAKTAIALGKSSRNVGEDARERPAFVGSLSALAGGNVLPAAGGVRVLDAEGGVVGAVGITGDTSDRDEACALAAISGAGLQPEA